MPNKNELSKTIEDLVIPGSGRGILAADESTKTISKRFDNINTESTEETRRAYRSLLCTAPELNQFVSGVILYEETLQQKTNNGHFIPEALSAQKIVPGIKVDKGLIALSGSLEEKITQGLDGLSDRLNAYKAQGARFAKWRAVFNITTSTPTGLSIRANAEMLARYAAICQQCGFVPIVEPELLMDGDHDLEKCAEVTENILTKVFSTLHKHNISLEHMILKPNMVIPAKGCSDQSHPEKIAEATVRVLRRTVPAAVPSINFLSGGQSPEEASHNLNAINSLGTQPWQLSFSYGRALQEPCLKAWSGNDENMNTAQKALLERAQCNAAATLGKM